MNSHFKYTEIVSNGFITEVNYHNLGLNNYLLANGFINSSKIDNQNTVMTEATFIDFILDTALVVEEHELVQTDSGDGIIYIHSTLITIAEKLDDLIDLLRSSNEYEYTLNYFATSDDVYSLCYIEQLLIVPNEIEFEEQRLGQLEWLDYAKFMHDNDNFIDAINAYNRYYQATNDNEVGFNVAVLLSSLDLDQLAVSYYNNLVKSGYDCHHNLAYSHLKLGAHEQGYDVIQQVDFDISLKSYLVKAQLEIKLKLYKEAIATLNQGFIATKGSNPQEADRIKKQFISLNSYLRENTPNI